MKTHQPRQPLIKDSNQCDRFRKACAAAGIRTPPHCGPAVRELLLSLRTTPLLLDVTRRGNTRRATPRSQPVIGMAIKAGFARFVRDEKLYALTPAGESWLQELEIHGLLKSEEVAP